MYSLRQFLVFIILKWLSKSCDFVPITVAKPYRIVSNPGAVRTIMYVPRLQVLCGELLIDTCRGNSIISALMDRRQCQWEISTGGRRWRASHQTCVHDRVRQTEKPVAEGAGTYRRNSFVRVMWRLESTTIPPPPPVLLPTHRTRLHTCIIIVSFVALSTSVRIQTEF